MDVIYCEVAFCLILLSFFFLAKCFENFVDMSLFLC